MTDQATILRGLMERRQGSAPSAPRPVPKSGAQTIAVTSGKGGVGKTNIALNLAIALARLESAVCLLDANPGLGNVDLLCGLNGYWNLSHVVTGARRLQDVILPGPAGIHVIPGASGLSDLADCSAAARQDVMRQLEELEQKHEFLVIDAGTGMHGAVRQFVTAADVVLVVTSPEPTSIADAYATIKTLSSSDGPRLEVVVNQVESASQGRAIIERLQQTARLFLHIDIAPAGCIPCDPQVPAAVRQRRPFQIDDPPSPAARAIAQIASRLKTSNDVQTPDTPFFPRFWRRLTRSAA